MNNMIRRQRDGHTRPNRRQPRPDPATETALRGLAEAVAAAKRLPPFTLDDHYLDLIARVEAMSCNRPGTDKTWLHQLHGDDLAYFAACRRLP
jgi:hypothetical protein